MKKSNRLLEQAKQGNVKVITALMNRQLKAQGMMADIQNDADCLDILIESDRPSLTADYKVPNQGALVAMIEKWLLALEVTSIAKARVSWQLSGQEKPAWSEEFRLNSALDSDRNLNRQSGQGHVQRPNQVSSQSDTLPDRSAAIDAMGIDTSNTASHDFDSDDPELAADLEGIPTLEQFPMIDPAVISKPSDRQAPDNSDPSDDDTDGVPGDPSALAKTRSHDRQTSLIHHMNDIDDNLAGKTNPPPTIESDFLNTTKNSSNSNSPGLVMQVAQFVALSVVVVLIMMGLNQLFGKSTSNSTKQSHSERLPTITAHHSQVILPNISLEIYSERLELELLQPTKNL